MTRFASWILLQGVLFHLFFSFSLWAGFCEDKERQIGSLSGHPEIYLESDWMSTLAAQSDFQTDDFHSGIWVAARQLNLDLHNARIWNELKLVGRVSNVGEREIYEMSYLTSEGTEVRFTFRPAIPNIFSRKPSGSEEARLLLRSLMGEFVDVHYYRIGLKSRIEVEDWLMENLITKKEFLNDPAGFIEEHGDRSFHFQKTDKTLSDVMTRFYHRHRREMNTIAEWVSLSTKED